MMMLMEKNYLEPTLLSASYAMGSTDNVHAEVNDDDDCHNDDDEDDDNNVDLSTMVAPHVWQWCGQMSRYLSAILLMKMMMISMTMLLHGDDYIGEDVEMFVKFEQ